MDAVDGPDRMSGYYFDLDGNRLDFDDVYWAALRPEEEHLWLAFGWQAFALGVGTVWYWTNAAENSQDWDYPGLEARLDFSAVRFDDNHFTINHVSHPFSGAAYYTLARSAGMGIAGASGMALLSSTIWEYGLEWRELVSLNDQFFTPLGGIALGEGIYRLGHYFNSAPGGGDLPQQILGATLGFPVWLHRLYDDRVAPPGPVDSLGFSAAYDHRFRLSYARAAVDDGIRREERQDGFDVAVDLYAIPGLGRPGAFDVFFTEGNIFDIEAGATWTDDGEGGGWYMRIESVMLGWLAQDITGVPEDTSTRWGTTVYIGLAAGYEHLQQWRPEPRDRWAKVLLPGPDAGVWLFGGGVEGRIRLSIHPTFDAIDSVAAPNWFEENPAQTVRSVLRRRGYYYGFGIGGRLLAELHMGWLRLEGEARFTHVESVEGLDREQEEVTVDPSLQDDMVRLRAGAVVTVPGWLVSAGLDYTRTERWGEMGWSRGERTFDRIQLTAGIEF